LLLLKLKKEEAGSGQDCSRQKEPGPQDERDAVLGTLKTDEGNSGEDEGQQAGRNLEVTLQHGVWLKGYEAKPHREEQQDDKASDTREDGSYATTVGTLNRGGLSHICF
jgi:hypothetical protein